MNSQKLLRNTLQIISKHTDLSAEMLKQSFISEGV